jgi:hypothetical protein
MRLRVLSIVHMTRRELLAASAAAAQMRAQEQPDWVAQVIARYDNSVEAMLKRQITDPKHRYRGMIPDEYGLYYVASAGGIFDACASMFLQPLSKFHRNPLLLERAKLAADLLAREQSPEGFIDNPITNFNSPADTAFSVRGLCPSVVLARRSGNREIPAMIDPFLRKAADGLSIGGIHTPNHRWVLSAALAQAHEIYGEPAYLRRIDQWLAEGVDIDPDGQYNERSTYVYNPITDAAFVVMAAKLKRPELLDPVRKNLQSMMYLMHPGYEVVTEISRRQDLNQRGDMGSYWFSLAYMAAHDKNGQYATIANHFAPTRAGLSALMEYPELTEPGPKLAPPPDNYRKEFPHNHVVRIRRGPMSATILTEGKSRFFTLRNGGAVINAVRFASAFFGRGQFKPAASKISAESIELSQALSGPYYQPFDPPRIVGADDWDTTRSSRKQSQISRLEQSVTIAETRKGFRLRLRSHGAKDVPLAVEINFREGGKFEGIEPAHKVTDGWILPSGHGVYRAGSDAIRFGPGLRANVYTQVRGAEPKLDGPSVYLTAVTPFDHTLEFECL